MEKRGTERLETPRLVLRRFAPDDAAAMYANWASDPQVTRYLTWPPHASVEATREILAQWEAQYADPGFLQWAIAPRELGEPIGSISVVRWRDEVDQAEFGYCIGKAWWGQGYTSEALAAVRDYLFDRVGIRRLQGCHASDNPASGAVMRKCGLAYEGTLRGADRNNTGICDMCVYGMLRDDPR
jgi:ribosomal-protein-alanine N-acetyltransferase